MAHVSVGVGIAPRLGPFGGWVRLGQPTQLCLLAVPVDWAAVDQRTGSGVEHVDPMLLPSNVAALVTWTDAALAERNSTLSAHAAHYRQIRAFAFTWPLPARPLPAHPPGGGGSRRFPRPSAARRQAAPRRRGPPSPPSRTSAADCGRLRPGP